MSNFLQPRRDDQRGDRGEERELAEHDEEDARPQRVDMSDAERRPRAPLAIVLAKTRIEMPRMTPGMTSGMIIRM